MVWNTCVGVGLQPDSAVDDGVFPVLTSHVQVTSRTAPNHPVIQISNLFLIK